MSKISSIISSLKRYIAEIKEYRSNVKGHIKPSLGDCIYSYIRYGCVLNHYLYGKFYALPRYERKRAFTYRHWSKLILYANQKESIHFLKNKVDFNRYFSEYIHRDWMYSKDMSLSDFNNFISKHGEIIVKPFDGLEGVGIKLLKLNPNTDINALYENLKNIDYLIEEKIEQHPDMIFGNKSVNTIRAYTIYNSHEKNVVILKTVIRIGIGDSIVDNSHSGGCAYEVDLNSGKIVSKSYCANGVETDIHPGTTIRMLGKQIPHWKEVKQLCKDAALKLTECQFIGWDIAITQDGPLLIEGNHTPDLDMIEFVGSHGYLPAIQKHLHTN